MSRFATCGLTIPLAFAPAALAVDGTVLINQSSITNGLTGCPTGGHFPLIICQSGSYRLSSNLTVPDNITDAIDITADNVTIDLNGFSILGPTVCSGNPVTCIRSISRGTGNGISSSNANIVVMNGQIKGMGLNGISLTDPGRGCRIFKPTATLTTAYSLPITAWFLHAPQAPMASRALSQTAQLS